MREAQKACGRIQQLVVQLATPPNEIVSPPLLRCGQLARVGRRQMSSSADNRPTVAVGDVRKDIHEPSRPEAVPVGYFGSSHSQTTLQHMRWMMQKDLLGQDMFLIGPPGPDRRRLALQYCEMTNRDVEYIALSRDTTEADLKQRREIRSGSTVYFDQCAVRAAIDGRVLILEGIEKAERNVLPVLNNLLENREMQLEDGRFLVSPSRYDEIVRSHSDAELMGSQFVRVDSRFRIIALGLPVPRFPGNPLDPPLRSRFQARDIDSGSYDSTLQMLQNAAPKLAVEDPSLLDRIASFSSTIREVARTTESQHMGTTQLPEVPLAGLQVVCKILDQLPEESFTSLLKLVYPYELLLTPQTVKVVDATLDEFGFDFSASRKSSKLPSISALPESLLAKAEFPGSKAEPIILSTGGLAVGEDRITMVKTAYQLELLNRMILSHSAADICLIGSKGVGKSILVEQFARTLGYSIQPVLLHKDMTARDLLQQRTTDRNGDTVWKNSPLITAAIEGSLAVLDGLHRCDPSTITVLQRLAQDREIVLHDGTHLMSEARYSDCKSRNGLNVDQMKASGIRMIHPAFRMIAVGDPLREGGKPWLTEEIASMFHVHHVRPLTLEDNKRIIKDQHPSLHEQTLSRIMAVAGSAGNAAKDDIVTSTVDFSTRQLLRMARRLETYSDESIASVVHRASLSPFLPLLARQSLERILEDCGIEDEVDTFMEYAISETVDGSSQRKYIDIGGVKSPILSAEETNPMLVPSILFYDNPQHTAVMRDMLKDLLLGEHLLLVGNQGVGKNKVVDRLLQLLNKPREYIQLHRDTTVQTLTQQPSVQDGHIVYYPSPLVRAIQEGSLLVIDEADKAPTHVTCVLKSLVESGDMTLSDGRRIVPSDYTGPAPEDSIVRTHPDFRMIVLANRPGFPFLGNDFYGSIGDVFACHAVSNPTMESELAMLAKYGPSVDPRILRKLVLAFGELRKLSSEGSISYPFSIRELVSIVKHLENYPSEGLGQVVRNVFDFDSYDKEMRETIITALQKHGVPIGASSDNVQLSSEVSLPASVQIDRWHRPKDIETICRITIENAHVEKPVSVPLHNTKLNQANARGSTFQELEEVYQCPFHQYQELVASCVDEDGEAYGMAIQPLQLFNFSITDAAENSDSQVFAIDMHDFFPMYHGDLDLQVVSLGNSLPKHAAIFDANTSRILLVDASTGKVQVFHLNNDLASNTQSNLLGRFRRASPASSSPKLKMVADLAWGGELIFFEEGGQRIFVLDLIQHTMSSVDLPSNYELDKIWVPTRESWLLQCKDGRLYGWSSPRMELGSIPSELVRIDTESDMQETIVDHPLLIASQSSSSIGDTGTRAIDSRKVFGGEVIDLCTSLSIGGTSIVNAHPRHQPLTHIASEKTYSPSAEILTSFYVNRDIPVNDLDEHIEFCAGQLEVVDMERKASREIPVSVKAVEVPGRSWNGRVQFALPSIIGLHATIGGKVISVDSAGVFKLWEVEHGSLNSSLDVWRAMIGANESMGQTLSLSVENVEGRKEFERFSGLGNKAPKHGKEDPDNDPHVGGNQWAGGTGGRDTAGLGGKGGPYRLDKGHDVHQLSDEEKVEVPEHIKDAAREMNRKVFEEKLREIEMSEHDHSIYDSISSEVQQEVRELKVILSGLEARGDERLWIRHQSDGDLDDSKLIDGLTGDQSIYKRRGTQEPTPGGPQDHPKRLTFVVDVSGSMYRFNGHDARLERMLQAATLVMEAFEGTEPGKFEYEIIGHSGESAHVPFVREGSPPQNDKERLKVLQAMHLHSQFCMSGDHTLEATSLAVKNLAKREDADERFVIMLSDANLDRYGIHPRHLGNALTQEQNTKAFCIMIGSLGEQAEHLRQNLPPGRGFVCMDTSTLPKILKRIFTDVMLK